jgi:hypothetical protein
LDLAAATAAAQARKQRGTSAGDTWGRSIASSSLKRTPELPKLELDGLPRPAVVEL